MNHTPKYVSKKKGWLWQYTVTHATGTYTAKLYGKKETGEVRWKMLISKNQSYEDLEWYTGISQDDNTSGTWSLSNKPLNPQAYMNVTWTIKGDKKEIKYTSIESGNTASGSYIQYGIDPRLSYDRYGSKDDYNVNIEWSKETKVGRVMEEGFYGDSNWSCWDPTLANIVCPD
jgi:hypothetical protein